MQRQRLYDKSFIKYRLNFLTLMQGFLSVVQACSYAEYHDITRLRIVKNLQMQVDFGPLRSFMNSNDNCWVTQAGGFYQNCNTAAPTVAVIEGQIPTAFEITGQQTLIFFEPLMDDLNDSDYCVCYEKISGGLHCTDPFNLVGQQGWGRLFYENDANQCQPTVVEDPPQLNYYHEHELNDEIQVLIDLHKYFEGCSNIQMPFETCTVTGDQACIALQNYEQTDNAHSLYMGNTINLKLNYCEDFTFDITCSYSNQVLTTGVISAFNLQSCNYEFDVKAGETILLPQQLNLGDWRDSINAIDDCFKYDNSLNIYSEDYQILTSYGLEYNGQQRQTKFTQFGPDSDVEAMICYEKVPVPINFFSSEDHDSLKCSDTDCQTDECDAGYQATENLFDSDHFWCIPDDAFYSNLACTGIFSIQIEETDCDYNEPTFTSSISYIDIALKDNIALGNFRNQFNGYNGCFSNNDDDLIMAMYWPNTGSQVTGGYHSVQGTQTTIYIDEELNENQQYTVHLCYLKWSYESLALKTYNQVGDSAACALWTFYTCSYATPAMTNLVLRTDQITDFSLQRDIRQEINSEEACLQPNRVGFFYAGGYYNNWYIGESHSVPVPSYGNWIIAEQDEPGDYGSDTLITLWEGFNTPSFFVQQGVNAQVPIKLVYRSYMGFPYTESFYIVVCDYQQPQMDNILIADFDRENYQVGNVRNQISEEFDYDVEQLKCFNEDATANLYQANSEQCSDTVLSDSTTDWQISSLSTSFTINLGNFNEEQDVCLCYETALTQPENDLACGQPFKIKVCEFETPAMDDLYLTSEQTLEYPLLDLRSQINSDDKCFHSDNLGHIYWSETASDLANQKVTQIRIDEVSADQTKFSIPADFGPDWEFGSYQVQMCYLKVGADSSLPSQKDEKLACSGSFTILICQNHNPPVLIDQALVYPIEPQIYEILGTLDQFIDVEYSRCLEKVDQQFYYYLCKNCDDSDSYSCEQSVSESVLQNNYEDTYSFSLTTIDQIINDQYCFCSKTIQDNLFGWKCSEEFHIGVQEFDTMVALDDQIVVQNSGSPIDESGDLWVWDFDFTLADILPQLQFTDSGPAQMEECTAKNADSGATIDWIKVHSPVNGLIYDETLTSAAVGVKTNHKYSVQVQIHCKVILDPAIEGAINPTVVSAAYQQTITNDPTFCTLGSTILTADSWITRFGITITPQRTDYEFFLPAFESSSNVCDVNQYEIVAVSSSEDVDRYSVEQDQQVLILRLEGEPQSGSETVSIQATAWGGDQLTMEVTIIYQVEAGFTDEIVELYYEYTLDLGWISGLDERIEEALPAVTTGTMGLTLSSDDAAASSIFAVEQLSQINYQLVLNVWNAAYLANEQETQLAFSMEISFINVDNEISSSMPLNVGITVIDSRETEENLENLSGSEEVQNEDVNLDSNEQQNEREAERAAETQQFAEEAIAQTLPDQAFNFTEFMMARYPSFARRADSQMSQLRPEKIQITRMSVKQTGSVVIIFSDKINQQRFEPMIGKAPYEIASMTLDPEGVAQNQNQRILQESGALNQRDTSFTWYLNRVADQAIEFKVNFTSPLQISTGLLPDKLRIQFTSNEVFQSALFLDKVLPEAEYSVSQTLTKQMPLSSAAESLDSAAEASDAIMKTLFYVGAGVQFLGSDALSYMQLNVRSNQYVLHMPILQLSMPANVMLLMKGLLPVMQWDMLDGVISWETGGFLKFSEEDEAPFPGQIQELGYESRNFMMNTQTIALLLIILLALVAIYCLLKPAVLLFPCLKSRFSAGALTWLEKRLFFGDAIILARESSMEFLIAGFLAWYTTDGINSEYWGDYVSFILATIGLFLVFIFMPAMIVKIWNKRWQTLQNKDFRTIFGELYEDWRTKNRLIGVYLLTILFRRIVLTSFGLFCRDPHYVGIQWIAVMFFVVQIPSIIIVNIRINTSRRKNRFELFNEWIASLTAILCCGFTDWVSPETQFEIGWYAVILISFGLIVTMYYMLYSMFYYGQLFLRIGLKRFMLAENIDAAPRHFKDALEEFRDPEKLKMLEVKAKNHKTVQNARKKLDQWKKIDKHWRIANKEEAKLTHTVFGPKGPIQVENIGLNALGEPEEDYGREDDWDASSFRKYEPSIEQDDIQTIEKVAFSNARKRLFTKMVMKRAKELKREREGSSDESSSCSSESAASDESEPKKIPLAGSLQRSKPIDTKNLLKKKNQLPTVRESKRESDQRKNEASESQSLSVQVESKKSSDKSNESEGGFTSSSSSAVSSSTSSYIDSSESDYAAQLQEKTDLSFTEIAIKLVEKQIKKQELEKEGKYSSDDQALALMEQFQEKYSDEEDEDKEQNLNLLLVNWEEIEELMLEEDAQGQENQILRQLREQGLIGQRLTPLQAAVKRKLIQKEKGQEHNHEEKESKFYAHETLEEQKQNLAQEIENARDFVPEEQLKEWVGAEYERSNSKKNDSSKVIEESLKEDQEQDQDDPWSNIRKQRRDKKRKKNMKVQEETSQAYNESVNDIMGMLPANSPLREGLASMYHLKTDQTGHDRLSRKNQMPQETPNQILTRYQQQQARYDKIIKQAPRQTVESNQDVQLAEILQDDEPREEKKKKKKKRTRKRKQAQDA